MRIVKFFDQLIHESTGFAPKELQLRVVVSGSLLLRGVHKENVEQTFLWRREDVPKSV